MAEAPHEFNHSVLTTDRKQLLRKAFIQGGALAPPGALWLVRANAASFAGLETEWAAAAEAFGEDFGEFATPYMDHAREIANGKFGTTRYGIYLLQSPQGCEGFAHLNVAKLPRTTGRTLRVLWILLGPRYDYGEVADDALAAISTAFILEPLRFASERGNPLEAEHVKVHLSNLADRSYFVSIAGALRDDLTLQEVAVRGNWLHVSRRA
jgi:hypothetical protein